MGLYAWQKLDWVLPGQPWGDEVDGDYSSATSPTVTARSASGNADSNTVNFGSSGFQNGDILKIVQVRGTNAGQWEIVRVASGGGTSTITTTKPLKYTYQDSGSNQAQAIKIPRYRNVTVQSGTWSPTAWNGDTGGELVIACKSITPTGSISLNAGGYVGPNGANANNWTGFQGEGTVGPNTTQSSSANGNGGGGGTGGNLGTRSSAGGAGGSYGSSGANGSTNNAGNSAGGTAGSTVGVNTLLTMVFGGAGGAGGSHQEGTSGNGGNGGGCITIFAKVINTLSGTFSVNGANGGNAGGSNSGGGGGGAGGSILLVGEVIDIGTDKMSCIGGSGGARTGDSGAGGAGGKGRIAVYYSRSLSGSVSSTLYGSYYTEQDITLKESLGGAFLLFV